MKFIEVVSFNTEEVVRSIDITGKSEREIDKIERGLMINMDLDNYFTRVVEKGD